jgi:hypothetical protein
MVGQGQVGIGGLGDLQGAAIQHQPGPATAELGGASGFEGLDKSLETAEVGIDLVEQGTAGNTAATRGDALPIEAVVPDLGGVVEHTSLVGVAGHGGDRLLEALALQFGAGDQVVEIGHVGVVVLAVVKLQGAAGDVGLERIKAVGQRGQLMSHG